jgi:serine/threonine-protein kinase
MASVTETQVLSHRFGEVAQAMGLVTAEQVKTALEKQKFFRATGGKSRLGEVFIAMDVLTVEQVRKVLSEQRKRRQADEAKKLPMDYFGEYKLTEKLGEGGMGTVFKAQETLAQRTVALKVLRANIASNRNFVERFDREARLAGSLSHGNIVTCHNAGTSQGVQFLAMEFVEGETLKKRLERDGKLPEPAALRIVCEVAQGLAHAHKKGVVHRDIKPDNILLGNDGSVKISDFGTAKSFLDEESLTRTGVIIGTPFYISPEQVRADKNIDHRADLYALGSTLYHLLTGKVPFVAATPLLIMRAHLYEDLENPADLAPQLSPGACQIVTKLMAKDPADRYQSADDVAADIERVLAGKPPVQPELECEKSCIRPRRMVRRKKQASGCLGMVLLCVGVAALLAALL